MSRRPLPSVRAIGFCLIILLIAANALASVPKWESRWRATDLTGQEGARVYSRWRASTERWQASLVTERDPGERDWNDHLAGYLQLGDEDRQVVLGDLRPGFGQGLLFSRGSGRSRGRARREAAVIGTQSSAEGRGVRGIAIRRESGAWAWALLVARLRWDARFDSTGAVRSLPQDGLHTGPTSLAGRWSLAGTVAGARLQRFRGRLHLGLSIQHLRFNKALVLPSRFGQPRSIGHRQLAGAIDANWTRGRSRLYLETARTESSWGTIAGLSGIGAGPARMSLQVRSYGAGFFSPMGGGPHRWLTANERGVVVEVRSRDWRGWCEASMRPEPWSIPDHDGSGEIGLERRWRHGGEDLRWSLRQRHDLDWQGGPTWRRTRLARLQGTLRAGSGRFGAQFQHNKATDGAGLALGVTGRWQVPSASLQLQVTRYRIDSWSARVYEYEATLPGAAIVRPLTGDGWRLITALQQRWGGWRIAFSGRWEQRNNGLSRSQFGLQIDRLRASERSR